jgi:COP9 signalosome complex subunit 4
VHSCHPAQSEELALQYKTCYARILDSKRRFLEAATRYYELSQIGGRVIGGRMVQDEDLEQALATAVTCTILAAAGPQRSRLLATLYKDERCGRLPVYPFLEKVYLERILRPAEVQAFSTTLRPHQLATLPDGSTVLDRSVTEHNLEAASKLYSAIRVEELAVLLGVGVEKAEAAAARMVMEKRLAASIDQVEGLIRFTSAADPLVQWDRNIAGVCAAANGIVEAAVAAGLPVTLK